MQGWQFNGRVIYAAVVAAIGHQFGWNRLVVSRHQHTKLEVLEPFLRIVLVQDCQQMGQPCPLRKSQYPHNRFGFLDLLDDGQAVLEAQIVVPLSVRFHHVLNKPLSFSFPGLVAKKGASGAIASRPNSFFGRFVNRSIRPSSSSPVWWFPWRTNKVPSFGIVISNCLTMCHMEHLLAPNYLRWKR